MNEHVLVEQNSKEKNTRKLSNEQQIKINVNDGNKIKIKIFILKAEKFVGTKVDNQTINNKDKQPTLHNKVSERLAMFEKKSNETSNVSHENAANKPGKLKPNIFTQGNPY